MPNLATRAPTPRAPHLSTRYCNAGVDQKWEACNTRLPVRRKSPNISNRPLRAPMGYAFSNLLAY